MSAARLAVRMASRRLRRERARTALEIGLIGVALAVPTVALGDLVSDSFADSILGDVVRAGIVGPVAATVVFVVIVTVLASSEQARLRAVGLWDGNGAGRLQRHLPSCFEGLLLGTAGTVVGLAVGGPLRYALALASDEATGAERVPSAGNTGVILGLGLGATVVATVVAAWRAGREPIRTLLAGRRPARAPRSWALGFAVLALVAGAVLVSQPRDWWSMALFVPAASVLVAGAAAYLGSAALTLLGPIGGRFRGTVRLALRGLARQRHRTGPVVGLITVVCGVTFVGAMLGASFGEREDRREEFLAATPRPVRLSEDQILVRAPLFALFGPESPGSDAPPSLASVLRVRALLPAGTISAPVVHGYHSTARFPASVRYRAGPPVVGIGDERLLRALGLPPSLADDLVRGTAVVLNPLLVADERVVIEREQSGPIKAPAVVPATKRASTELPAVIVSPTFAGRHRLGASEVGTLFRAPGALPTEVISRLQALNPVNPFSSLLTTPDGQGRVKPPEGEVVTPGLADDEEFGGGPLDAGTFVPQDQETVATMVIAGMATVLVLVLIAVALSTVGRRSDDELFAALGARPDVRRWLSAVQALLLVGVGAAVAVGLGTAATAIGFASFNADTDVTELPPIPLVYPWAIALLLVVALPVVAAALTWLCTTSIDTIDLHRLAD